MSDVLRPTDYTRKSYTLPSDAYQKYQSATGATLDNNTGLLTISSSQYSNLQPLSFNIGGISYNLSPNGQIWPRSLNTYIGGNAGSIYLIVNDLGSPSGQGLDFIDGQTLLYAFYVYSLSVNAYFGCLFQSAVLQCFRHPQRTCWVCYYPVYQCNNQLRLSSLCALVRLPLFLSCLRTV